MHIAHNLVLHVGLELSEMRHDTPDTPKQGQELDDDDANASGLDSEDEPQ